MYMDEDFAPIYACDECDNKVFLLMDCRKLVEELVGQAYGDISFNASRFDGLLEDLCSQLDVRFPYQSQLKIAKFVRPHG